ncbi:heterokaryon incompatibility protein-domain-containing protein [Cercophora samala]|uniref:Heterokaryon incompatibility protein-domain-containing protein n=1 Tax=Cercophora samala TaxID=330535 RepID=A0AA39ZIC3_9PEZI|nr:heterokaryon incompatibility protein-domain-containing protein [Cercophora samala]
MAVPQYQYHQLDLSQDAIRLVRLCKGYDGPLRCELFESFLHECDGVPYNALSYTWGKSIKQDEITINGCKSFITENLYCALWNLREQHVDRVLWIDAICIDQDNHKERGHQVGQMRNIYENAEEVIVWLGERTILTDTAMDLLDRVNRHVTVISTGSIWKKSKTAWLSDLEHRRRLFLVGMEESQVEKYRQALQTLFQSPWFKRIWVIQEVAHSRRSTITCGRRSVPARTLAMAPGFIQYQPERHVQSILDVMPGFHRQESWWTRQRSLNTLLDKFKDSESTDPRDKVFALLGMALDAQGIILPDYEVSESVIVQRVASFMVFGRIVDAEVYEFPQWPVDSLHQCVARLIEETLWSATIRTSRWTEPYVAHTELCEDELLAPSYTGCRYVSNTFTTIGSAQNATNEKLASGIVDVFGTALHQSDILYDWNLTGHISLGVVTSLGNFVYLQLLLGYPNLREAYDSRDYVDGEKFRAIWLATYKSHCKALRLVTHASHMTAEIPAHCVLPGEGSHVLDLLLSDTHGFDMEALRLRLSNWGEPPPLVILIYAAEIRTLEFLVARGASPETIMALPNKQSWLANITEILAVMPPSEASTGLICTRLKAESLRYATWPRQSHAKGMERGDFEKCLWNGHVGLVKLALMRGVPWSTEYSLERALITAAQNGQPGVVKALFENVDVTVQAHTLTSAIYQALIGFSFNKEEVAKVLLEVGSDVLGQLPLDLAHSEVVNLSSSWPAYALERFEEVIRILRGTAGPEGDTYAMRLTTELTTEL